jgi:hypothetical protein
MLPNDGSMRLPGKSGLTFDHIFTQFQGELQNSRKTGAEPHNLTGAINDIHDASAGLWYVFIFVIICLIN